ncbi:hypothetical protein BP5796_03860 [Coleophoma crateriformis]|uniref:Alpha/beta hydrolase fold-3 domain-containing protein n=1 Tax=Coleophoma crateriformis TaxID=565419 RepID=A0A3D8SGR3_9HELO|nr:hypothetical protein BP5796_03860 [Coleophoma crateriformis]
MASPQPPYPLHPSVATKLDTVYVSFYNAHIFDKQQVHYQPVAASRTSGVLIPGGGPKLPVASTEDILIARTETEGPDVAVRVFTPEGEKPEAGWPVMIYYHGGGWVLGNIDTENTVCTNLCSRAACVVITVDYRLAPENPYPAAVHDSWEALVWVFRTGGARLGLDLSKAAVGGSSAGGNLAAIMCHKLLTHPPAGLAVAPKFLVQLLIVPVTDNTAAAATQPSWAENEFTAALPALKMLWYRKHYLPLESSWSEPEASPLLYPSGWAEQPPALIVVGELDVLRSEGEAYAQKLESAGVPVDLKIMKGMPHPFLAMDAVLQQGRDTITFMVEKLKAAFA